MSQPSNLPSKHELWVENEYRICKKDPLYFLTNYWKIQTIGKGYAVADLWEHEKQDVADMHAAMLAVGEHQRQIKLKARQLGWTTIACGMMFHNAFFNEHHPWLVASQGLDEAKDTLLTKVKTPYLMLPRWLKTRGPALLDDNSEMMSFDNGSRIISIASTSASGRSKSVYGVLMDEAAFMETADELFAALDPLCYGPMFVFSTANGMGNWFHDTWVEAQLSDSEWEPRFWPWSARPDRDEDWYERTKRKYRGQMHLFYQEYPSTPAEAFAKSGRTAFDLELLEEVGGFAPPNVRLDISRIDMDGPALVMGAELQDLEEADLELWVWEFPTVEKGPDGRMWRAPNYCVSVDVAEGLAHGDYSAVTVYDAHLRTVVASMKAHMPIEDLGPFVEWLGYWYHTALVGVERNNAGLVPLQYLQAVKYPRLYRMDSIAQQKRGDRTPRYGWHTNKTTKPKMVIDMTKALRDENIILSDERILAEARTFLADGKGGYGASPGNHDDIIIAAMIGLQLCEDVGDYPIVWSNPDPGPTTIGELIAAGQSKDNPFGTALRDGIGQKPRAKQVYGFEIRR